MCQGVQRLIEPLDVVCLDGGQEVTCQDALVAGLTCGRVDSCKDLSSRDHGPILAQDHTPDKSRPVVPSPPKPPSPSRVRVARGRSATRTHRARVRGQGPFPAFPPNPPIHPNP